MSILLSKIPLYSHEIIEPRPNFIYLHPTLIKTIEVIGGLLGSGILFSSLSTSANIGTSLTGSVLVLASAVSWFFLDIFIPPHHDMKTHVYQPQSYEGGQLYYDGDVPVLSLDAENPFKAGKAQGYLCGSALNHISKRFDFVMHTLWSEPRSKDLSSSLEQIRATIPKEYVLELEGIIEGYNEWKQKQHKWKFLKKITMDDLLLMHLLPDSNHFLPQANLPTVACSSIVEQSPDTGPLFARTMDWPSFGILGTYSLVIHRHYCHSQKCTSIAVGIPGLVGIITGMNEDGLSAAMNSCHGDTKTIEGMPAVFYNRMMLEQCSHLKEVKQFVNENKPLGPYHLIVADETQAQSFHLLQNSYRWESPPSRKATEEQPLITLNYRYNPHPYCPLHYSDERQEKISTFFQTRQNEPVKDTLILPFVNNAFTTHCVIMQPRNRKFAVAFDNAFAGNTSLQSVSTEALLHRVKSTAHLDRSKKFPDLCQLYPSQEINS